VTIAPPDFRQIAGVTFDVGGTLLFPHPSVGEVYATTMARHGMIREPAEVELAFRAAWQRLAAIAQPKDSEERQHAFWRAIVRESVSDPELNEEAFEALFAELWEEFSGGQRWRLAEGAQETLSELCRRGYRLAALSNWDARLHRTLQETGLMPPLECAIISSEAGAAKPHPEIFRWAERRLGLKPEQLLHVGDETVADREGASRAGWSGLVVKPRTGDLASLDALLRLLPGR
jgi:putative hydrolase of the HAD superfamily